MPVQTSGRCPRRQPSSCSAASLNARLRLTASFADRTVTAAAFGEPAIFRQHGPGLPAIGPVVERADAVRWPSFRTDPARAGEGRLGVADRRPGGPGLPPLPAMAGRCPIRGTDLLWSLVDSHSATTRPRRQRGQGRGWLGNRTMHIGHDRAPTGSMGKGGWANRRGRHRCSAPHRGRSRLHWWVRGRRALSRGSRTAAGRGCGRGARRARGGTAGCYSAGPARLRHEQNDHRGEEHRSGRQERYQHHHRARRTPVRRHALGRPDHAPEPPGQFGIVALQMSVDLRQHRLLVPG